jgi:small nuclear ribonucleoprotein (snRNP)-like protein
MGTFAKIFIVVNLVLAVVFLGAASTLLGTIEDYKGKWDSVSKDLAALKKSSEAKEKQLNDDIDAFKIKTTKLENEKSRLESAEKVRNEEWLSLKTEFNKMSQTFETQASTLKDLEKDLADARVEIAGLNTKYDKALSDTRAAKQTSDDLRNDLERANGNIAQLEADLAATQKEKTELAEDNQKKANLIAMIAAKIGSAAIAEMENMPDIRGQVTGVDEDLNIVLVSVGVDDDVKVGFTMTVYRGGEYVGKLVIDKVGPDWASGHMDQGVSKSFPVKGDEVATQL